MQRYLDGASKPRQLEYVTTTTEASGQEQISRSTCNLQEPLPWPFRRLGKSIHRASDVDLKMTIDGATYQLRSSRASRHGSHPASYPPQPLSSEELDLYDHLCRVRKQLAKELGLRVPCHIFPNTCLQAMASFRPVSRERFACLPRVGPARLDAYFHPFSQAIAQFSSERGLTTDLDPEEDTPGDEQRTESVWTVHPTPTQQRTAMLYRAGHSVQEIAEQRALSEKTVVEHLCAMIEAGEDIEWERLVPAELYTDIVAAIQLVH